MTAPTNDHPADAVEISPAAARAVKDRRRALALLTPGVLWMTLFMLLPLCMVIYVSFWTQTTFTVESTLTTASWERFLSSPTYLSAIGTTLRIWVIVLLATLLIGYPVALFIGLFVKNRTLQTALLVACVIPFWTSFLIRVIAWRPMLGTEGAINIILNKLGITSEPLTFLLFSEFSVIVGMTQIYCVFMVGPITFMIARIDGSVIEAARDLGASFGTIFRRIVLPLSMPGVVVGAIFVSVMVLGEFATAASLSGRKVNLLGNIIVSQVGSLKWAFAAVAGVVLTIIITAVITLALRIVDIRKEM
ncbi:ABC transporter permease [Stappia sp. ES.058]|uniref:ABC transporter permease n=1 Tax=Stappia sp. ES.058 TaxID=1881061 RepID=UPI00087A5D53|nr:ABC transporter permease [Stappia sp. ES.058]SDU48020.1 putative spermidine/putrescine transport system permease protein [Stappia sp. ES.058]